MSTSKSTHKLEKLKEMESTINKLEKIITKTKQEMKYLDVEWLHLRGLVTGNSNKIKPIEPAKSEVNFDDANKINSEQFNPESLLCSNTTFLRPSLSDNLSENESSDED